MHWRRKRQPTPVFLPGESQGREAWWAAIYGVAQSRTRLKRLSSSSSGSVVLWEGGMLQTNNTGMCSQCLGPTGFAPGHSVCAFHLPCSGSRLLCRELSEAGPGLYALPRSKPLRFRHSGSPQRRRLSWACILCPSQVRAAQVMRCLASMAAVTYCLPRPCH